ncbi:MAG: DUF4412 domain-containing protein [Deltaproteobacteria bacterium]|nr:DUF4412 domain-containing protein [Deltaproteobacteria bacterium]
MKQKSVFYLVAALLLIPSVVFAFGPNMLKKEFSAEEVITTDPTKNPGVMPGMDTSMVPRTQIAKVFMAKTMSRWDEGNNTTIVRLDKKLVYVVDHLSKTYTVMPMDPNELPAMLKDFDKSVGKKKLGTERVDGWACTKWQFTIKMDDVMGKEIADQMKAVESMPGPQAAQMKKFMAQMKRDIVSTVWIAEDLGAPIKTVTSDGTSTILRKIKVGTQSPKLFEPPAGYRKSDMPGQIGSTPPPPKKKAK